MPFKVRFGKPKFTPGMKQWLDTFQQWYKEDWTRHPHANFTYLSYSVYVLAKYVEELWVRSLREDGVVAFSAPNHEAFIYDLRRRIKGVDDAKDQTLDDRRLVIYELLDQLVETVPHDTLVTLARPVRKELKENEDELLT